MRRSRALRPALAAALVLSACGAVPAETAAPGWSALKRSTIARTEVAAARIGSAVFVVGGYAAPDGRTTNIAERYDLRRNRWRRVAPMPVALNHAAAVAHRGRLYVAGGYGADNVATSVLLRYDPRTNRWRRLRDMPTRRAALVAGVIGGRIYAAGGVTLGSALATLEIYDIARNRWRRGPSMRVAREHLAGAVTGGAFYVIAGRAAGRGNFAVVERFVPRRNRWETRAPARKERGGIAATSIHGDIVLVGGEEPAGTIAPVERYDPGRNRWSALAPMRTPRHGLGAITHGSRVFAIEGGPRPGLFYSDVIEALRVTR